MLACFGLPRSQSEGLPICFFEDKFFRTVLARCIFRFSL